MDPYLEGSLWSGIHAVLSVEIARQLSPRLLPKYVARTNERLITTTADEGVTISKSSINPDAFVTGTGHTSTPERGGVALAPPPLRLETVMPVTVRQITVEILDTAGQKLVTAIEILSPFNKRGDGRDEYLAKRQKILLSTAHLMEIDLLRAGQRVPMRDQLPPAPYFVLLSRAEKRPFMDIWPIKLDESLPNVPVPLLAGEDDVSLDLQSAFSNVYDQFGYAFTIDYRRAPDVPLAAADRVWAEPRIAKFAIENRG
jgi:hypothetical protein